MMMFSSLALLSLPLLCSASFPGSAFGIKWNSTSPYGQSKGQISLVDTSLGKGMVLGAETAAANVSAFFAISGKQGYLDMTCPEPLKAVLVPGELNEGKYEVYHFIWMDQSAEVPEGAVTDSLTLGPAPAYDGLVSSLGNGIWHVQKFEDNNIISWINKTFEENRNTRVWLQKTSVANVTAC
ncbi:hypothetical protein DL96DRAFT_1677586 [Flagelloscypha sp. PMI_526]|nr:hypothetical protein DL96DRAFT_1677586 [Flagelloscypha sp. PMI_526]